jgi:hypothetical protein
MTTRDLFGTELANLPILAKAALDIATGGGNGKRFCTGSIMKERLFLDGIVVQRTGVGVDQGIVRPAPILPHPAGPPFPIGHLAFARAKQAPNPLVTRIFNVHRFVEGGRIDRQALA